MDGGDWSVRLYCKPFIRWIWLGGLCMAAGGLLSASDRRYRMARALEDAATVPVGSQRA
jgi:cytochrome c-type biogenesis protein CcmF